MSLEDYGVSTGILPHGGGGQWHYQQEGLEEIIYADSPESLCKKILRHRLDRGVAVGNIEQDVAEFIKRVSPQNDRFRRHAAQLVHSEPKAKPITPLIERIKEWLVSKQGKISKLTDQFEAVRRGEICAQCPQNIPWRTSCGECNSDIDYRVNMVRQRTEFQMDKKLRACRLHNLALQAAVLLDQEELPEKKESAPAYCWLPIR